MSDWDKGDPTLLNRIGRVICELAEGDIERNVMLQKICEIVKLDEKAVTRVIRFGMDNGLFKAPTANQVKLTPIGANRFCAE